MNRRIRVLHLIDNLDLGGAQTALFRMLEYFDRSRFEVVLAAMHAHQGSIFFARAGELGVRVVPPSPRRWLPWYFATLPGLLIRGRFDVVHCHLYVSNWLGKPLVRDGELCSIGFQPVFAPIENDFETRRRCRRRFRRSRTVISRYRLEAYATLLAVPDRAVSRPQMKYCT